MFLVHHGEAVDSWVDTRRPLTSGGVSATEALARLAAARGVAPAHVWHSGKLRAKQTAELYWRQCNALASCRAVRGLQPSDDPETVRGLVVEAEGAPLMLVGHFPHMPAVLALLTGGAVDRPAGQPFPLHGLVVLDSLDDGRLWSERFRLVAGASA